MYSVVHVRVHERVQFVHHTDIGGARCTLKMYMLHACIHVHVDEFTKSLVRRKGDICNSNFM